jgi:leucyl-tRNA synthetase
MEFVNEAYVVEQEVAGSRIMAEIQRHLALLLAPFAPYLAHELWEMIGEKSNLLREPWPKYDQELAKEEEIEIPVQINGKLRSRILVAAGTADDAVRELALADERVRASLDGKKVVKAIVVPGKLVNLVVS